MIFYPPTLFFAIQKIGDDCGVFCTGIPFNLLLKLILVIATTP
jgi:hypothetical protein